MVSFRGDIAIPCSDYDSKLLILFKLKADLSDAEGEQRDVDSAIRLLRDEKNQSSEKKTRKMLRRKIKDELEKVELAKAKISAMADQISELETEAQNLKVAISKKMSKHNQETRIIITSAMDVRAIAKMREWMKMNPAYRLGDHVSRPMLESIEVAAHETGVGVKVTSRTTFGPAAEVPAIEPAPLAALAAAEADDESEADDEDQD